MTCLLKIVTSVKQQEALRSKTLNAQSIKEWFLSIVHSKTKHFWEIHNSPSLSALSRCPTLSVQSSESQLKLTTRPLEAKITSWWIDSNHWIISFSRRPVWLSCRLRLHLQPNIRTQSPNLYLRILWLPKFPLAVTSKSKFPNKFWFRTLCWQSVLVSKDSQESLILKINKWFAKSLLT